MKAKRFVSGFVLILGLGAVAACSDGGTPSGDPKSSARGSEINEEERIAVDVKVGSEWVTVHPTADGIGAVARAVCALEVQKDRETPCSDTRSANGLTPPSGEVPTRLQLEGSTAIEYDCENAVCHARKENCAGALFEELAQSPLPRQVVLDGPLSATDLHLTAEDEAKLQESDPTEFRLLPALGAAGAAALRASLEHYAESARLAHILYTVDPGIAVDGGSASGSCTQVLSTLADPSSGPSWLTLHLSTFIEAATHFSAVTRMASAETKSAAMTRSLGSRSPAEQTRRRWNVGANSMVSAGRTLAYGKLASNVTTTPPSIGQYGGANDFHKFFNPRTLPTCPPKTGNNGLEKAIAKARNLGVFPALGGSIEDFADDIARAHVEDLARDGTITVKPVNMEKVLNQLGITRDDASLAATYLQAESAMFGLSHTKRETSTVPGFDHVERVFATDKPQGLPAAVIATHFLGDAQSETLMLDDDHYGDAGAIRAIDQMHKTASMLKTAVPSHPLNSALDSVAQVLSRDTGGVRLHFSVGEVGDSPGTVDLVALRVYGVNPEHEYFAVQGLRALKCVLSGSVDGASCDPTNLATALTHYQGVLVHPFADDLEFRKEARADLSKVYQLSTTVPSEPATQTAIADSEAIYILEQSPSGLAVLGGGIPKPGSAIIKPGVTRQFVVPTGGILQDELARLIGADQDDCSEPEESCAGLPGNLVPPLGSELVGDQTSQSFESGWKHYLDIARKTADEADRLGEELIRTGLDIDHGIDQASKNLMDLCGADGKGCSSFSDEYVTLGDKKACLWTENGKLCGSSSETKPCPFYLDNDSADCTAAVAEVFDSNLPSGVVPLNAVPLGMAPTPENIGQLGSCKLINQLRYGIDDSREREKKIRELANIWNAALAADAAGLLKYTELFADNYRLEYAGQTVFDTNRQSRPSLNKYAKAPCVATASLSEDDSAFWSRKVDCFVSGEGSNCPNDMTIGKDGCQTSDDPAETHHQNADSRLYWSLDTEPAALRNRWAWGFGHLRRSVATLGLITGKLGSIMTLSRVLPAAMSWKILGTNYDWYNPVPGPCEAAPAEFNDPSWVRHCSALGCGAECRASVRCIDVTEGDNAIGSGLHRTTFGRPVNANGFIANMIASQDFPGFGAGFPPTANFPSIGVDPQMVYCGVPNAYASTPEDWTNWGTLLGCSGFGCATASGWVGASASNDIGATFTTAWKEAVDEMWELPSGEFCSEVPAEACPDSKACRRSAVWRAFCQRLPDPSLDELMTRDEFMTLGKFKDDEDGIEYVNAFDTGRWIQPIPGDWDDENSRHATVAFLYDMRTSPYVNHGDDIPLQYGLNARAIIDAMDLLCHATRNQAGAVPDCTAMQSSGYQPKDMTEIAAYLGCVQDGIRRVGGAYVTGPVPQPVIDAFTRKIPIASTTGLGGAYLDGMVEERGALEAIAMHYDHVADALQKLGYLSSKLHNLEKAQDFEMSAAKYRALETKLSHLASAFSSFAQAGNILNGVMSLGSSSSASTAAGLANLAAASAGAHAAECEQAAMELTHQTELWDIVQGMRDNAATARDSMTQLRVEIDRLTSAAAKVRLVQAKGKREEASATLADYWDCEDPAGCPMPYNTALRRTYNTKLIRYQNALERARKAAFVARRAIEVRFGVKLSRIQKDMSFVQAPSTWADGVCEMTGIKYDEIRDADGGSESIDFSGGAAGDDYADDYIGDYVTKLEDFVRSYPFDYPLRDSDDTAVLSLSEDLFKVTGDCLKESDNLLVWSSDFDQSTAWQIGNCKLDLPAQDGGVSEPWRGCLSIMAAESSAAPELPSNAKPFLVRNANCTPSAGDHGTIPEVCPEMQSYLSSGTLSQEITIPFSGMHRASVYVRSHGVLSDDMLVQVVRGASEILGEAQLPPYDTWQRLEVPFSAAAGDHVTVVIKPSMFEDPVPAAAENWKGVLIAAAQVEWVPTEGIGEAGPARAFQRTTAERMVRDPVCHQFAGPELRRRFTRQCERICMSGVGECKTPQEEAKAPQRCFYETSISLPIEAVQQGALSSSGQFAAGNFNYRHNTIGLNIVGSGVHDCEDVPGAACYQNGFVEYTLVHDSANKVSNWEGGVLDVNMPTASIEHGKAVAAERVVTNPPSSADSQLLEPFTKSDFRGRPINGNYRLRIWDGPGFVWDRVEDIQLVWRYHYWTRQEKTN